jgi:hypothetical protein
MNKAWLVPVVIAGGVLGVYATTGGCLNNKDPDQKLAGRFDDLCEIASDGIAKPEQGVRKLGRYLGSHADDMLGELGGTVTMIEKISNDDAHDARAQVAHDRLAKPLVECAETWMEFADAIENDAAADALLERGLVRLGRTLEIIFGEGAAIERRDFRNLPWVLMSRLDRVVRD